MENIVLIGMPSCGKSTVGVLLAKRLGYRFLDCDLLIQEREGKRLHELIEAHGADGFLAIENRVNASIEAERTVISTGGSAIYRGDVIEKMKKNGVVVYLRISYEEMAKRLGDYKRRGVVLQEGFTLRDLYEERAPLYEQHADYILSLDGESVEESADKLAKLLGDTIREEDYAGTI